MTRERVSVIIPVLNEEAKIAGLLDAILRQSARFDEVVITDGTSRDRTREIIEGYQEKDPRIILVVVPGSRCGEGRNHSIRKSSGDILVFLDAGMVPEPSWLERLLARFEADGQLDFVFGRVVFDAAVPGQSAFQRIVACVGYPGPESFVRTVPAAGLRRRLWDAWDGLPEAIVGEDYLLFNRLERERVRCARADDAIVRYFDFPRDLPQVWRKWLLWSRTSAATSGMMMDHARRLVNKGAQVCVGVLVTYLAVTDVRWLAAIPACLFARACWLTRRHPEFFRTFLRRPDYWLTTVVVSVTIDGARLCGFLTGTVARVGRRLPFGRHAGAPSRSG